MVGQASSLSKARVGSPCHQGPQLPILLVKIHQGRGKSSVAGSGIITGKRQQQLSWGLVSLLVIYFLDFFTHCSLVYADLFLHQVTQARHPPTGHCLLPSATLRTGSPLTTSYRKTSGSACCDLISAG